jgi:hypothetical protein
LFQQNLSYIMSSRLFVSVSMLFPFVKDFIILASELH